MNKRILLIGCLTTTILAAKAQTNQITGTVYNEKNEVLAGASVAILPQGKVYITDAAGKFSIPTPTDSSVTIRVTYSGYATMQKEITDFAAAQNLVFNLKSDVLNLNDVLVVSNVGGRNKLNSSVSVSSVKQSEMQKFAPRTTAELFRALPGIKVEASGGEGNTNITVRGVPISSGGSKYLQLQEDGLPVLLFGDISFATSDIFLRADQTLARLEAIRGGSASVLGTNSPAGIINFVSKTGNVSGGTVGITAGVDYNSYRADFNYGYKISKDWSMNVGGFYRYGKGPRTSGYDANKGGQVKFNVTKQFKSGYIRLYAKYLNDKSASFMPMPIQVTGTNSKPTYTSLSTFDIKHDALQSTYMMNDLGTGRNGEIRTGKVANGMNPLNKSIGLELKFDLGKGFSLENRGRYSAISGNFISPFPSYASTTANVLTSVASTTGWDLTGASLTYAKSGATYTGTNAMELVMFDVTLNNFNNYVNDFKINKKFNAGNVTLGFYKAYQHVGMSWLCNSYLTDINGKGIQPLLLTNASGTVLNPGGVIAYGTPQWGNIKRDYNTNYNYNSPYVNGTVEVSDALTLDGGVRLDMGRARGNYSAGSTKSMDMNGNGVIDANETSVEYIDYTTKAPVHYNYNYVSYSLGANYKLDANKALFARYSSGATTKADRILFTSSILSDGSAKAVKDAIDQGELGFKGNFNNIGLFVTGFYARINEQGGYEVTTQQIIENHYRTFGAEVEAAARISNNFDVKGSVTLTHARIISGTNKGNQPRRQAPVIFNLVPTYTYKAFSAGFSSAGTSSSYTQNSNMLKMKGYVVVNPFVNYKFTNAMNISVNANNVFNSIGITEAEDASITNNATNIIRARSITGRTLSASLFYNF